MRKPDGWIEAVVGKTGVVNRNGREYAAGGLDQSECATVLVSAHDHALHFDAAAGAVGMGTVREVGGDILFEGSFFLWDARAEAVYRRIVRMGDRIKWSIGTELLEVHDEEREGRAVQVATRYRVSELSPTKNPATDGTRTLYPVPPPRGRLVF